MGSRVLMNIDYSLLNNCRENIYFESQLIKGQILAASQSFLTASILYLSLGYSQLSDFIPPVILKGMLFLVSREERMEMYYYRKLLLEKLKTER